MHSRLFGYKESDDLDKIFSMDDWETQPDIHQETQETGASESALQTPMSPEPQRAGNSNSAFGTDNTPRIIGTMSDQLSANRSFDKHFLEPNECSDSAVGTESQLTTPDALPSQFRFTFLNRRTTETFDSQASDVWPLLSGRNASQVPSESLFSQDLATSSINAISDGRLIPATNNDRDSQQSFDNFFMSTNSSSQHQPTNNTSFGNLSFYSLMQRSLMNHNFQGSTSSIQLPLISPTTTQTDYTQGGDFSHFFNSSIRTGNEPTQNSSQDLSQVIANSTNHSAGSNGDFFRQFEDQPGSQSQLFHTTSSIFDSYRQVNPDVAETQQYSSGTSLVPQSILDLKEQIKGSGLSDWSFVYALAAQSCQEFMPMSYNVTLKTSLLLSIASIDATSEMSPIPIIAFGHDSTSANRVMNFMGNFAQRFLAPTDHLFNVMVSSDKMVEVGPVFLAKNGVCYLGDWSGLSKKFTDEIKILIDSGRFFINETSESLELGSALWTYWSPTKNRKDFSQVAVFMKYFGIPIMTESNESDDMIEFLLMEARDGKVDIPDDVLNISTEDMKNYLNVVRKKKLRKEDDAQQLLKAYSDTIQRDRGGLLSAKSFQIIQQMAESFAKLSLRDNVSVCDVVGAISIAEKTFHGITGMARCPLLPPTLDIEKVDQYIQAFHKWIINYVGML